MLILHDLIFYQWELKVAILALCAMWAVVGYLACGATHKQRGLEADRPVTDILPQPPSPVIVPDDLSSLFEDATKS